jgi:hypothetical protein
MADYGLPEPTTGPWVIGAYYRNTEPAYIYKLPNFGDRETIKVPTGSIWLCHKAKIKLVSESWSAWKDPVPHVTLVVRDPRYDYHDVFITWDVRVWTTDNLLGPEDQPSGFERVESPLECLAFAADDSIP